MTGTHESDRQIGVQSLETGLSVLASLLESPEPMRLIDIAEIANMAPAKAHRYLVSFVRLGYVEQERSGLYRLGSSSLRLGMHCISQLDPSRVSIPFIDELSFELNETVFSAIWTPEGPIIVNRRGPWRALSVNIRIGTLLPLIYSAAGRIYLGFAREQEIRTLLEKEKSADPPADSRHRRRLSSVHIRQLQQTIRTDGYAVVDGDYYQGVNSVSAPVFDHSGQIVIALTVVGMSASLAGERWDKAITAVRLTAGKISAALGYSATSP